MLRPPARAITDLAAGHIGKRNDDESIEHYDAGDEQTGSTPRLTVHQPSLCHYSARVENVPCVTPRDER